MQNLPHRYPVSAEAAADSNVTLTADRVPALASAPPAEFGGPGDQWSPESLLVGAVADCFVLTFRAIARASKLEWHKLHCHAVGVLDRVDGKTLFTSFEITAQLEVPEATRPELAERMLGKAENACLITNSMTADVHLTCTVTTPS